MKFMTLLIIVFFFIQIYGQQQVPDLTISLLVHDNASGVDQIISFGLDSTATDGIDPQLGEVVLAPDICPNLASFFCAKFILPDGTDTFDDYRFGTLPFTGQIEHKIWAWMNDTSYTIVYNFPTGVTVNFTDVLGGLLFDVTVEGSGQIDVPYLSGTILSTLMMFVNYENVVPVELTSFTASVLQEEKAVQLNWETATETNNSGFEIQKTSPLPSPYQGEGGEAGRGWEAIGFVPGFGTTTEPISYSFIDENITKGTYKYRLKQIDYNGTFEYSNEIKVEVDFTPEDFVLYQNYPNPFNPTTTIKFEIPGQARNDNVLVTLIVYDVLGNEVATLVDEEKQPGVYEVEYDASSLSSGMYLYKLQAGAFVQTKKMILAK